MKFFNPTSWIHIVFHILTALAIGTLAILFFFHIYLPINTNHGETITVPDVIGIAYEDLDDFLTNRDLRYEVTDSGYSAIYPPLAVLQQFPAPNARVKEKRKIYLTLNSKSPPLIRMPDLIDGSMKNALMALKAYDLKLGKKEYVPDLVFNTVLEQRLNGESIEPGIMVPKGSIIDVVLGDGLGKQELESPNLIGLDEESAIMAIEGSGLNVGKKTYVEDETAVVIEINEDGNEVRQEIQVSPGSINRQRPIPGRRVRLNDEVDIWIYRPDSVNLSPSLLDN